MKEVLLTNGIVRLDIDIEDSSIHEETSPKTTANPQSTVVLGGAPLFRSFRTVARLTMREGEQAAFTLATDKQTGETLRVSVTATRVR